MLGRLIGVDHGLARIGVALSDVSGLIATEHSIITRQSKREDFAKLNEIAAQEGAVAFVVGVPHSDAPPDVHTQADTVRLWMARFAEKTDLPVVEWDESLTSDDARELAKMQKRRPQDPIDDLAARLILQSYLDALRDGLATPPTRHTD